MNKALFFDFDGVIIDSVEVKAKAFYDLFLPYGEEVATKVLAHHRAHGGISRYEKIPHYFSEYMGQSISKDKVWEMAGEYGKLVLAAVMNAPYIGGAREFIERYAEEYICFIISGTPEEELLKIVEAKGLTKYFKEVKGSPAKKVDILGELIPKYEVDVKSSYFLGDAPNDQRSAKAHGVPFILVKSPDNDHLEAASDVVLQDFVGYGL